jgi:hypothetical protein
MVQTRVSGSLGGGEVLVGLVVCSAGGGGGGGVVDGFARFGSITVVGVGGGCSPGLSGGGLKS